MSKSKNEILSSTIKIIQYFYTKSAEFHKKYICWLASLISFFLYFIQYFLCKIFLHTLHVLSLRKIYSECMMKFEAHFHLKSSNVYMTHIYYVYIPYKKIKNQKVFWRMNERISCWCSRGQVLLSSVCRACHLQDLFLIYSQNYLVL